MLQHQWGLRLAGYGLPLLTRSPAREWGHSSIAGRPPPAPRRRGSPQRPLAGSHGLRRGAAPASCTRWVLGILSPCGTLTQPPASSTDLWVTFTSCTIWEKPKCGNGRGQAGMARHGALPENLSPQSPIRAHVLGLLGSRQAAPIEEPSAPPIGLPRDSQPISTAVLPTPYWADPSANPSAPSGSVTPARAHGAVSPHCSPSPGRARRGGSDGRDTPAAAPPPAAANPSSAPRETPRDGTCISSPVTAPAERGGLRSSVRCVAGGLPGAEARGAALQLRGPAPHGAHPPSPHRPAAAYHRLRLGLHGDREPDSVPQGWTQRLIGLPLGSTTFP